MKGITIIPLGEMSEKGKEKMRLASEKSKDRIRNFIAKSKADYTAGKYDEIIKELKNEK